MLGIDSAPAMVGRLGEELTHHEVANAEVRVGDAEHLDLEDASYDIVTGGFMIFFPPDPVRVLGEIRVCCAPVAELPFRSTTARLGSRSSQSWRRRSARCGPAASPGHRFNEAAVLHAALTELGFRVVGEIEMGERFRFELLGTRSSAGNARRGSGGRSSRWTIGDSRPIGSAWRPASNPSAHGGRRVPALDQRAVAVIADASV